MIRWISGLFLAFIISIISRTFVHEFQGSFVQHRDIRPSLARLWAWNSNSSHVVEQFHCSLWMIHSLIARKEIEEEISHLENSCQIAPIETKPGWYLRVRDKTHSLRIIRDVSDPYSSSIFLAYQSDAYWILYSSSFLSWRSGLRIRDTIFDDLTKKNWMVWKMSSPVCPFYHPLIEMGVQCAPSKKRIFAYPRDIPPAFAKHTLSFLRLNDESPSVNASSLHLGVITSPVEGYSTEWTLFSLHGDDNSSPTAFSCPQQEYRFHNNEENMTVVPHGTWTVWFEDGTLFSRASMWALIIFPSLSRRRHNRFRSYIMQRIMWMTNQYIGISYPLFERKRNHNQKYSEENAHTKSSDEKVILSLLGYLLRWKPSLCNTFVDTFLELIRDIHLQGWLTQEDVEASQSWIHALQSISYSFPRLISCTSRTSPLESDPRKTSPWEIKESKSRKHISKRVAVCVSGQPRTLSMSLTDPAFPHSWAPMLRARGRPRDFGRVFESIQRNLFSRLEETGFDVFMYVSTREGEKRQPRVGDLSVCETLRPRNSTNNRLFCRVERERTLSREAFLWKSFIYPYEREMNGLFQQLYGMHKCHEMIQQEQMKTGVEYATMIRLRPDTSFMRPFPRLANLSFHKENLNQVLIVDKSTCCCGNEDWFGVGAFSIMQLYMDRLLFMKLRDRLEWNLPSKWSAEMYLEAFLSLYARARLSEDTRIHGCLVKPTDRSRISDG